MPQADTLNEDNEVLLRRIANADLSQDIRVEEASDESIDRSPRSKPAGHAEEDEAPASKTSSPPISCSGSSVSGADNAKTFSVTGSKGSEASEDGNETYWERDASRLKSCRNTLIYLCIALCFIVVVSVAGIAVLSVQVKSMTTQPVALNEIVSFSVRFPTMNNSDATIATIIADHSLGQTFYGVVYDGPLVNICDSTLNDMDTQMLIATDIALLSRITNRIEIAPGSCYLADRAAQAIDDLSLNLKITLSMKASAWADQSESLLRLLRGYPRELFDKVYLQSDSDPTTLANVYAELTSYLGQVSPYDVLDLVVTESASTQVNPLGLSTSPNLAIEWLNSDISRSVYERLRISSTTEENLQSMITWVCDISPHLEQRIAWYWADVFDSDETKGGLFDTSRRLKPSMIPKCAGSAD